MEPQQINAGSCEQLNFEPAHKSDYEWPEMGSAAEIKSFNMQIARIEGFEAPTAERTERVLNVMETLWGAATYELPKDFMEMSHIVRECEKVRDHFGDKTPGAILMRQGMSTNDDVFAKLELKGVAAMVMERIEWLLSEDDPTPIGQRSDPNRIFVKREGHKKEKIVEGRVRLIWSPSLIDRIVDQILYSESLAAEIENCSEIPNKVGYNFKNGGTDRFVRRHLKVPGSWTSFDASGHDINCRGYQLKAENDLVRRLNRTQGPKRELWERLNSRRFEATFIGSAAFSDGTLVIFNQLMIVRSGLLRTISINGRIVTSNKIHFDVERGKKSNPDGIVSLGDDTMANDVHDQDGTCSQYIAHVKKLGNKLTQESVTGKFEDQNFISMIWKQVLVHGTAIWVSIPLNWYKNTWNLCNIEKSKLQHLGDSLHSACLEYAYHDNFPILHAKLSEMFPEKYKSAEYYRSHHHILQ